MMKIFRILPLAFLVLVTACSSVSDEEQAAIDNCVNDGKMSKSECKCFVSELIPQLTDEEKAVFLSDKKGDMDSGMSMLGKVMTSMGACGVNLME